MKQNSLLFKLKSVIHITVQSVQKQFHFLQLLIHLKRNKNTLTRGKFPKEHGAISDCSFSVGVYQDSVGKTIKYIINI